MATFAGGGVFPPKAKVAVEVPAAAKTYLAEFKSPTSVQLDPFQLSTTAVLPGG